MRDAEPALVRPERHLKLVLRPEFDRDGTAECIHVNMTFHVDVKHKQDVLFDHVLTRGPTHTTRYTTSDIRVISSRNSHSPLPLHALDSKDGRRRQFCVNKELIADTLSVSYRARPSDVTELTPCGPQIALERDGGGLSGCGQGFLLGLAEHERSIAQDIVISWDLAGAPPGTRAVSTFGEGTDITIFEKPAVLEESFFMVGPIHSYPRTTVSQPYGTYWLSQPPWDVSKIGAQLSTILPQVKAIFDDKNPLFRIFIRHNDYKCSSGRGLHQGFVFAWNSILPREEEDMSEFLFHEIIHNWPRLGGNGPGGNPTLEDLAESWWNEGVAEYYSLIIPLRLGIWPETEFVQRFNRRISGYYTNPDRALKNSQIQENFWKAGHANRIPYQRGFMYFVMLAHQLKHAGKRGLDELMLQMVRLRRDNKPHTIQVWLDIITAEIGETAMDDYHSMSDADPIRLPPHCMRTFLEAGERRWTLKREDQEEFYLGFPERCLAASKRKIEGLDPESRAASAGVREGDIPTAKFSYTDDAEQWDKLFMMTVRREELVELKWWPRSYKKVESYQFKRED